jgi:cell division protein WhiA
MSFSKDIKKEVLQSLSDDKNENIAFLSGLFRTCGELNLSNKQFNIKFNTEMQDIYDKVNYISNVFYDTLSSFEKQEDSVFKERYTINIVGENVNKILLDTHIINSNKTFIDDTSFLSSATQKIAYLKGLFVGGGTCNDIFNKEKSVDYNFEITLSSLNICNFIVKILKENNIIAKYFLRKSNFVVYIKSADGVSDALALIGASNSMLKLNEELALRSIKNKANRASNCDSANINKMVSASMKQLDAINIIMNTIGLESLSEDLREVAMLRLANSEESLSDLLVLLNNKMTKSALDYKFRKIIKIANENKGN